MILNVATGQPVNSIITPLDRFGLTLSLAILLHALIILGITFTKEDTTRPRYDAMEIILVKQRTVEPKKAKKLAQASSQGGDVVKEIMSPINVTKMAVIKESIKEFLKASKK